MNSFLLNVNKMTPGILLISLLFMGVGFLVQMRLKNKFKQYGKQPLQSGLTGKQVAENVVKMTYLAVAIS